MLTEVQAASVITMLVNLAIANVSAQCTAGQPTPVNIASVISG